MQTNGPYVWHCNPPSSCSFPNSFPSLSSHSLYYAHLATPSLLHFLWQGPQCTVYGVCPTSLSVSSPPLSPMYPPTEQSGAIRALPPLPAVEPTADPTIQTPMVPSTEEAVGSVPRNEPASGYKSREEIEVGDEEGYSGHEEEEKEGD